MNHLLTEFERGLEGRNTGLDTGIPPLNKAIDGIQRKSMYGLASSPKVGKSTLVDYSFVLSPYLKNPEVEIQWIYFSFEVPRVEKEFKFVSFFFYHDYGILSFIHNDVEYPMSPRYLLGRLKDEQDRVIIPSVEHQALVREIYERRIVPLFGRHNLAGSRVEEGKIRFIEEKDNPTGMRNLLMRYAKFNGNFTTENYNTHNDDGQSVVKQRITGYIPNNPDKFTIIITDHIRKLRRERGYSMKENIDKWVEYSVELRNWCGFTFVHICHLNRSIAALDRIKYNTEFLYPTGDDVKDSGNLSEEVNYMLTMFNANDDKYGIKKHFGLDLINSRGEMLHPYYRSIHLTDSRDTECPQHMQVNMYGGINTFGKINN